MSFLNEIDAERQMTQRRVPALWMVALMLLMSISSSAAYAGVGESELEEEAPGSVGERTPIQTTDQNWRGNHANDGRGSMPGRIPHPALLDPQYGDPAVMYGKVADESLLRLHGPGFMLEETNTEDHDNDGINDLERQRRHLRPHRALRWVLLHRPVRPRQRRHARPRRLG